MQGTEKDKERAKVYDALGHRLRIAILKSLSDRPQGFAELKRSVNIESSGQLTHHLNKLNNLIVTDQNGKYCLSDKGKEALLTMQPIEKYTEDARFREQVGLMIRALRSNLESVHEMAIAQISLLGPKAIPFVRSALSEALAESQRGEYSSDPERAVIGLTRVLGIMGVPGTVTDIAQALPRNEAFEGLAKIGNKQALDVIVSSIHRWPAIRKIEDYEQGKSWPLSEKETEEIDNFLRKIFSFFDDEGRRALETALRTEGFEEKNVIARILAVIGDDKSIPALTAVLEKGDFPAKTEAAIALRRLKAAEAVPKMVDELLKTVSFLSTPREETSGKSHEDFWKEKEKGRKETEEAREALAALAEALLELGSINDWITVAFSPYRATGGSYFSRVTEFDKAIIDSKDKAVAALAELLQAPDPEVQRKAADMIAKIKSK
jgi:HEAT repeat protein/DNA-binding HxlR family transcriptional regulator